MDEQAPNVVACHVCDAFVRLRTNGTLYVHGPRADRCAGSTELAASVWSCAATTASQPVHAQQPSAMTV